MWQKCVTTMCDNNVWLQCYYTMLLYNVIIQCYYTMCDSIRAAIESHEIVWPKNAVYEFYNFKNFSQPSKSIANKIIVLLGLHLLFVLTIFNFNFNENKSIDLKNCLTIFRNLFLSMRLRFQIMCLRKY